MKISLKIRRCAVVTGLVGLSFLSLHSPVLGETKPAPEPSYNVRGSLSARYVYRIAELPDQRFSDQDIYSLLRLDLTSTKEKGFEFHFLGSGRADLDGHQDQTGFYPLEDTGNAYDRPVQGYLLEAHLDMNKPLPLLTQLRLGRQSGTRDELVFFDGLAVDFGNDKVALSLYGGATIYYYEIDNRWGNDTIQGAGLDLTPFTFSTLSLDYLETKDKREIAGQQDTLTDRLASAKLLLRIPPVTRLTGKYRTINGDPRDVSVRATTVWADAGGNLSAGYFRQFRAQNELTNEFALFYDVIGRSSPYESYDVKLRQFIATRIAIDAGYFSRKLLKETDQSVFDKDFSRAFVDVELSGCVLAGLSCMAIGEQWKSKNNKYDSMGFDASYAWRRKNGKEAKISVGTYYSLYKYDYYIDPGVRDKVRTYYLNVQHPFTKAFSMNGGYEYEDSIENYTTVKVGMRYDF